MSLLLTLHAIASGAPGERAELVAGGQVGLLGWQRAGNHAALLGVQGLAALRGRHVGASLLLDGALARDRNDDVTLTAWPLRAAMTVDVVVRRRGAAWVSGVGPGLSLLVSRAASGGARFGGVSARPLLRVHSGLDGPLAGRVRWRVSSGAGLRPAGVDWDVAAGLVVVP